MLKLCIGDFKTMDKLDLDLAPLTSLLGPPGKSNILDALLLASYLNRIVLLAEEYGGDASNLWP